jgi:hypothetical protein
LIDWFKFIWGGGILVLVDGAFGIGFGIIAFLTVGAGIGSFGLFYTGLDYVFTSFEAGFYIS